MASKHAFPEHARGSHRSTQAFPVSSDAGASAFETDEPLSQSGVSSTEHRTQLPKQMSGQWDGVTNRLIPIPMLGGAAGLLSIEDQIRPSVAVQPLMPTDRNAPVLARWCTMFCGFGDQFMDHSNA